jgi:hypothetical protein
LRRDVRSVKAAPVAEESQPESAWKPSRSGSSLPYDGEDVLSSYRSSSLLVPAIPQACHATAT